MMTMLAAVTGASGMALSANKNVVAHSETILRQLFKSSIDKKKHLVLTGPHPSPLSSYRGFFGCDHFKKANSYLKKNIFTIIQILSID